MSTDRPALDGYPTAARGVMRFHLVYHGSLPSAGNKSKPEDVLRIRRALSPQLEYLWDTHSSLHVLKETGAVMRPAPLSEMRYAYDPKFQEMMETGDKSNRAFARNFPAEFEDLISPLSVGSKEYMPLVRKSLDLACELDILFLRQQGPGELFNQGGDIDGRIKALLDALRMPEKAEQDLRPPPEDKLWTLLESDALVSDFSVQTDRLLFPETTHQHEVHLVIEVKINVLKVGQHNVCLL